jgi:hypothetical protein
MRFRKALLAMAVGVVLSMGSAQHSAAVSRPKAAALVVSPKRGDRVQRSSIIFGRSLVPGCPLVLVRPAEGDRHWWVQPPVEMGERGYFRAEARFGNSGVAPGSEFDVLVVVLRSQRELDYFIENESLAEVPRGVLQSEQIRGVLSGPAPQRAGPVRASILKPRAGARVRRMDELLGKVTRDARPVVLVRCDKPNSLWWVQDEAVLGDGGSFRGWARLGNASTPAGTRFQTLVVLPRSEQEIKLLQTGATLAELPAGIPRSRTVTVVLQPDLDGD